MEKLENKGISISEVKDYISRGGNMVEIGDFETIQVKSDRGSYIWHNDGRIEAFMKSSIIEHEGAR